MAAYNESLYNQSGYNLIVLVLSLFETVTSSDAQNKSDEVTKAEVLAIADTLFKLFNNEPFPTETITSTDQLLNTPIKSLLDIVSINSTLTADVLKSLPETLTLNDIRTVAQTRSMQEFVLFVDSLTKQITDKLLPLETVRLNDWLEVKNNPQSDPWN